MKVGPTHVALTMCFGFFLMTTALTACSTAPVDSPQATEQEHLVPVLAPASTPDLPAAVTDTTGKRVVVRDTSRIVSLSGGISETLVSIGLADNIVGRDVSSDFDEVIRASLVTNGHDVSAEGVLSLDPSLVLADARTGPPETLAMIENAGVPVVRVPEVWALSEVPQRVEAIAAAVGRSPAADAINTQMAAEFATIAAETADDPPVVAFLYLRGTAAVYLLGGRGSGGDDMIAAAGGIDAGTRAGLENFTPLTPEALVSSAPDVILVMTKGLESVGGREGLLQLPGVGATPAGRAGRVVAIPDGELLSFGPRTPQTVRTLAEQLRRTQVRSDS